MFVRVGHLLRISLVASGVISALCFPFQALQSSPEAVTAPPEKNLSSATFQVRHSLLVKDIPAGARKVRIWFWLPDDDEAQKLLNLTVPQAPAGYRITRDAANGHRYLYAEVDQPKEKTVAIVTDFVIRRNAVYIPLDPAKAGALTDIHRAAFADYLRKDVPNMEVDDRIAGLAKEICGSEQNVVIQARKLYEWVVKNTDHYSKDGAPKSSGKGAACYCLDQHGGGCTDQHALFIALARARGIPTRLHFGSLLRPRNEGKDVDPGYRCWVQYFVPNYGWVPADLSAGDTDAPRHKFYASGLDERRIRFLEGRDLELTPRQDSGRLNLMIAAHVEVDGRPHISCERVLKFVQLKVPDQAAVLPEQ